MSYPTKEEIDQVLQDASVVLTHEYTQSIDDDQTMAGATYRAIELVKLGFMELGYEDNVLDELCLSKTDGRFGTVVNFNVKLKPDWENMKVKIV